MTRGRAGWYTGPLYSLALAGYPLVAVVPVLAGIDNRLVSVPFRAVFLLLSIGVFIVGVQRRRFYSGLFWLPLGVFWLLYAIRILLDTLYAPAELRLPPLEYVLYAFGMAFVPMLAFMVTATNSSLERARTMALWAVAIACCLALTLGVSRFLSGGGELIWSGRLGIRTLNPIALGHLGASACILAAFSAMRVEISSWRMVPLLGVVLLGVGAVAASASRGPALALAFILPAMIVSGYIRGARIRAIVVSSVVITGGLVVAQIIDERFGISLLRRAAATASRSADWSSDVRVQLVTRAWNQFGREPILGSGLEEQVTLFYPHNVLVESFMATGVLGGAAFAITLAASLFMTLRLLVRDRAHAWIALLFLQYVIGAQLSGSLYSSVSMWYLLGAVASRSSSLGRRMWPGSDATRHPVGA